AARISFSSQKTLPTASRAPRISSLPQTAWTSGITVREGSSPRGSLMLVRAARALALVHDREYVIDQDLIDLAPLVIAHRLRMKDPRMDPEAVAREITMSQLSHVSY
ncbi:MAG: hypothetical protein ABSG17_25305, partial [Spirochaetia bacterium]